MHVAKCSGCTSEEYCSLNSYHAPEIHNIQRVHMCAVMLNSLHPSYYDSLVLNAGLGFRVGIRLIKVEASLIWEGVVGHSVRLVG